MKPQDLQTLALAALTAPKPLRWNATGEPTEPAAVTAAAAIAAKVDELGALRSAIADLTTKADQLRTKIEEAGLTNIDGQHYSATLTSVKGSTRIDWQTIAAKFKPSRQLIAAHTTTGKAATRLNLTARKITH
jgi:aspartate aminotransferase-like enzyme